MARMTLWLGGAEVWGQTQPIGEVLYPGTYRPGGLLGGGDPQLAVANRDPSAQYEVIRPERFRYSFPGAGATAMNATGQADPNATPGTWPGVKLRGPGLLGRLLAAVGL